MYTTKRYKRAHSVLNLKVLSTCLARGKIFENFGPSLETRKGPKFLNIFPRANHYNHYQSVPTARIPFNLIIHPYH